MANRVIPSSTALRIAIAGAGLVGRLLAWRLVLQGHSVCLFEQGSFARSPSAAHTAAAMISPLSEVVVSERSIYELGMQSLALWPNWIQELGAQVAPQVHYAATGSLVVAHTSDINELHQFHQDLQFHLGQDHGAVWLDRPQIREREPDLADRFEQALYLPHEAYLDNRALLQQLHAAIQQMGGECRDHSGVEFQPWATLEGQPLREFDWIVDCRGMGAQQSQTDLRGVRGEVLWVHSDEVQLHHAVRLMHPRYKLYIVPKPGQRFIIGATEIESQDRSPMSVQSMLELCSALYTLHPAFAEARILELDANLRPSYWDNMPQIEPQTLVDPAGNTQRILRINGLYRHGYLLAPTLVQQAIDTLTPTHA